MTLVAVAVVGSLKLDRAAAAAAADWALRFAAAPYRAADS
jgi:hypothetical protein